MKHESAEVSSAAALAWTSLTDREKEFSLSAAAYMCEQASGRLMHLAGVLSALPQLPDANDAGTLDERDLLRRVIGERNLRSSRGGVALPEAAWNVLTCAYLAELEQERLTVKVASLSACVPMTTALRHIALLVNQGLMGRQPYMLDRRVVRLELTENGRALVSNYLQRLARVWGGSGR